MLHKICNIQGFSFQFKKDSDIESSSANANENEDNINKTKLGVIAQNIEEEFPELVNSLKANLKRLTITVLWSIYRMY